MADDWNRESESYPVEMVEKHCGSGGKRPWKNCAKDVDVVEESVGRKEKSERDNQWNCSIFPHPSRTVRPSLPHQGFISKERQV